MQIRGIELYEPDINLIPYYNYQKLQRYLVLGAGLGSNTTDILSRLNNIRVYADNDRLEDVQTEADNLTLAVYSTLEGLDYDVMAFACMVKSIDGHPVELATDDNVKAVSDKVIATGMTRGEVQEYIDLLKKKLMPN